MVSVRRVAPILFLAVATAVWAAPQAATKTDTQAPATTKKTAKAPAKTTSAAPTPAPTTTSPATKKTTAKAMTTPAPAPAPKSTTAKTTSKTTTKAATKKEAKPAAKKAAEKPAAKKPAPKPAEKTAAKAAPKKSTRPPKNLHKVRDHWTPYNPPDPATYPAGAKTYTIKPGDTLWGLATQFYNNGYMWPQLWEANTWITDAHWIYPGDVLLVEGEIAQQAEAALTTGAAGTTGTAGGRPGTTTGGGTLGETTGNPLGGQVVRPLVTAADALGGTAGPVPLAEESDIYCYGYIGDPNEPLPNAVGGWEDAELRYQPGALVQSIDGSEGDLAYINGGSSTGLTAGETYILVVPRALIKHPTNSYNIIGRQYDYVGQMRVLCVDGQRSRGIITRSCAEVPVGARLKPMPQLPIPLARIPAMPAFCDPASGKRMGYIVSSQGGDWLEALGEGYLVMINLGRDDQVLPGEFLTVFRNNPPEGQRQILGELAVLTSEAHTATAKIVLMRYNMHIGDGVEIR